MDTEALQTPNHVFLATHNPITMYLQSLTDINSKQAYNEQQFLQDFLGTPDFAFVPVLGGAGTGKSHLVRWLAVNIPETPNRKVLLIPRAGTNLKDIIERILNVMEGSSSEDYRARLNQATSSVGENEARGHLLSNLANLIQYADPINKGNPSDAESYVVEYLPALLNDWYFREHLLKNGQIIEGLVTHIIGHKTSIEVVDERRSFNVKDLPLGLTDYAPERVGERAREFYSFLISDDEIQKTTVDLMNHHLDGAIAQMLQLNREDLERLMREVRETLAEQDIELVLLIEDFAKLQGIDRQVLAAVIERPEEEGRKRQCALRTALACTTGYFDSLRDTVRQRTTFSVSLDVEVGERSLIKHGDVASFVTRYLNAARLQEEDLINWYENGREESDAITNEVPNQCESCSYQEPCHAGFGSVKGVGFYPFTSKALERMYERVETKGRFIPRKMIRDVLRHTLENYAADVADGQFPSPPLQQHFGGAKIGANLQMQIRAADPVNSARREVLIDLWTDGTKLVNLHPRVHEAFELQSLNKVEIQITSPTSVSSPLSQSTNSNALPSSVEERILHLDAWANGTLLPQKTAQKLRPLVFNAVRRRIDWDAELLLRGKFVGSSTTVFSQPKVNFDNAATRTPSASGVELLVPTNSKQVTEAAAALQALLKHEHFGNWSYPGGSADFRIYAKQLDVWSRHVVEQIRHRPRISGEAWNPVPAVAELLALGARMAGRPSNSDYGWRDVVSELFATYELETSVSRSDKWRQLFEVIWQSRTDLINILIAYIPCTKGGEAKVQIVDAVQLVDPIKIIRNTWQPQEAIPNDLRTDFKVIVRVREKVDELLKGAIEEEKARHIAWREEVVGIMGEPDNRGQVISRLRDAIDKVQSSGDFSAGGVTPANLQESITRFEGAHLNRCVAAINRIEDETDDAKVFEELSRIPQDTMNKTQDFLMKAKAFVYHSTSRVETRIEELRQSGGSELESSQQGIRESLQKMQQLTMELRSES